MWVGRVVSVSWGVGGWRCGFLYALHQHHRGDPCRRLPLACAPSVIADTIVRTTELGVTITDAAIDIAHHRIRSLLHSGALHALVNAL